MSSWWEDPGSTVFKDLDFRDLNVDEAYLTIKDLEEKHFSLYSLSEDCYKCPFSLVSELKNRTGRFIVNTKNNVTWRLYSRKDPTIFANDTRLLFCEDSPDNFGEFGVYEWHVLNEKCDLITAKQPVSIRLPLIMICFLLLIMSSFYYLVFHVICKPSKKKHQENEETRNDRRRIKAIDTFRGICILSMIFINDGGGAYWFFNHATWNGLLPADFIFPWFLWIMGVCIPISLKSQRKKAISRCSTFQAIIKRTIILFTAGLALNTIVAGPSLKHLRIFGVMQRLAVSYFATATVSNFFTFGSYDTSDKGKFRRYSNDVLMLIPQWIIFSCILAVHIYLTFFYPVPGCPLGYLGPGGLHENGMFSNCTGGAAGYFDTIILGVNHIFQNNEIIRVYGSQSFDPEGLLGCLTSIFQTFLGVQAGAIMIYHKSPEGRLKRWLTWSVLLIVVGLILCQLRINGGWIPLNKNLWSVSFVMITSGFGFALLSFCYFIIDHCQYWNGSPFFFPGMNSFLLYCGHEVTYKMFPWHYSIGSMNTHFMLTIEALWGTAVWAVISYMLYKNKFFLTI
ncbi:heparan-alpha-glucosaminide N-acetyltransferase isoform X2 [Nilaparvata lugens]|nr:heparan-alpha-glucosaminide N-acetyltransferase isoform X2 [Nilaparvata lugens]XP_022207168.1 heparan-alpha-glucosaminide N-acetyltransferase isoform X2 [Nilaparvata lugens]